MPAIPLGESPGETEDTSGMPKPIATVTNPATKRIERIYKNIENEPLIKKIRELENDLKDIMGIESVEEDLEEMSGEHVKSTVKLNGQQKREKKVEIFTQLLSDFQELLKTPYGSLGYLVMSDSESIQKLYHVDSDGDYYYKLRGSSIRISNEQLEGMVTAGGGKRWWGEGGYRLSNPAEIPKNMKITDNVINEIIDSVRKQLAEMLG